MATIELPRVQVQSVTLTTSGAQPLLINRDPSPGEVGVPIDSPLALELVDLVLHRQQRLLDGRECP